MGNDRPGQATRSVERWEDALRVRTAIVAQQLAELKAAASDLAGGFWPVAGFASIADVTSYLSREIGRANAVHLSRRRVGLDDHEALEMVVAAEATIDAIGREPAVVAFLAKGASVEAMRFKFACRMLIALFDVPADLNTRAENGGQPS